MKKIVLRNRIHQMAASLMLGCLAVCLAGCSSEKGSEPTGKDGNDGIVTYPEQTEWYYRSHEGYCQKRLWSITEGKWLTDWIDC